MAKCACAVAKNFRRKGKSHQKSQESKSGHVNWGWPALRLLELLGSSIGVGAVLGTLDLVDKLVDGLNLLLQLLLGHLLILLEHPGLGHAVSASHAVKGSEELAIVDLEARVVEGVASSTVDDGVVGEVFTIVDHDRPQVDENEKSDVGHLLQGEDEGEEVVGNRLSEAIERVESMAGKGSRHDPLVVRLVKTLVDERMVEVSMNPVDAEVGKDEEEGELEDVVPHSGTIGGGVVELSVAADFEEEERGSDDGHNWHGLVGLDHLEPDLVLEESGVVEGALVEDEDIGEGGDDEVDGQTEEPVASVLAHGANTCDARKMNRFALLLF